MNKIVTSDKIYIFQSKMKDAGRGVFAKVAIKKGETIERCPVIDVPKHDTSVVGESTLVEYFYFFGTKRTRIQVVLGFGSIYNHTYSPNATYKEQRKEMAVDFIALKDIKKDEEITVNYAQGNNNKSPLWFEVLK
ncbi:MAG TPA: SET domain-containing protein-lysine N-methyltransferase [Candidatus Saccharimonadales bacterium]|nr:SET domain-containing protein-lysine N-methyltransferase [Candidatus Saccharimonadales bacterium]